MKIEITIDQLQELSEICGNEFAMSDFPVDPFVSIFVVSETEVNKIINQYGQVVGLEPIYRLYLEIIKKDEE